MFLLYSHIIILIIISNYSTGRTPSIYLPPPHLPAPLALPTPAATYPGPNWLCIVYATYLTHLPFHPACHPTTSHPSPAAPDKTCACTNAQAAPPLPHPAMWFFKHVLPSCGWILGPLGFPTPGHYPTPLDPLAYMPAMAGTGRTGQLPACTPQADHA